MNAVDEILAGYDGLQAAQEAFYQDLHEHPELSHHEFRTARCVAGELQKYGFTVQTGIGGTGVAGVLANGPRPVVLLRAELDALPVRENTGVDYASTMTTKAADGHEVPVDHSPEFLPPMQPTLRTGTEALVAAAMAWLAPH
jgi:metal-dependent amidase/aminoacylase/carboxypeptidase family protein